MREKIWAVLEPGNKSTNFSKFYDYFMIVMIILSVIPLAFKNTYPCFTFIELFTVSIFIIDYICRWVCADFKLKRGKASFLIYPFTPMAIVDLLSILPVLGTLNPSFKLFRMLRLARVLRVFKLLRYSKSVYLITNVFRRQRRELLTVCTLAIAYILVAALIIMNVEPESFDDFFEATYWATVSLTTVGYGDIYPVSTIGRGIAMISSIVGIAVIALPSGIITAGYMNELTQFDEKKFNEQKENEAIDWSDADEGEEPPQYSSDNVDDDGDDD